MQDVREVYPKCAIKNEWDEGEWFSSPYDYDPLLESFGYEIAVKEDEHNYQGDSFVLFRNGLCFGVLVFGWGSCSGCDALQACNSYEDVEKLQKELHEEILWFDKDQVMPYLLGAEQANRWYQDNDVFTKFRDRVFDYIMKED
jgi:hypothetical protein